MRSPLGNSHVMSLTGFKWMRLQSYKVDCLPISNNPLPALPTLLHMKQARLFPLTFIKRKTNGVFEMKMKASLPREYVYVRSISSRWLDKRVGDRLSGDLTALPALDAWEVYRRHLLYPSNEMQPWDQHLSVIFPFFLPKSAEFKGELKRNHVNCSDCIWTDSSLVLQKEVVSLFLC